MRKKVSEIIFPSASGFNVFKKKQDTSIWGITVFFNPRGYKNKIKNYHIFRESSKKQGLNLLAIELGFGKDFELSRKDADILIRIKGNERNLLWQKERLLNIALKKVPKNCDKIVWLDCDIIFENPNWVKETSELLLDYKLVQPFSKAIRLSKGSLGVQSLGSVSKGEGENEFLSGVAFNVNRFGKSILSFAYSDYGHTGFAWAARREIFGKAGFFDRLILGSGDLFMAFAFFGADAENKLAENEIDLSVIKEYKKWAKQINELVGASVFFTNGTVLHLWHGDNTNRRYTSRYHPLAEKRFVFNKNIVLGRDGLWEWSFGSEGFSRYVSNYFKLRAEESISKKILVISPTPSHPQNAGNRARIYGLLKMLQRDGNIVHFVYLDREMNCNHVKKYADLSKMAQEWDNFYYVSPYSVKLIPQPVSDFVGGIFRFESGMLWSIFSAIRVPFDYVLGRLWVLKKPYYFVRSNLWRVQRPVRIFLGKLWVLKKPYYFVRGNLWRIKKPFYFLSGNLWRLKKLYYVFFGWAWILKKPYYFVKGNLWKFKKPYYILKGNAWKLKKPYYFFMGNLWRLKKIFIMAVKFPHNSIVFTGALMRKYFPPSYAVLNPPYQKVKSFFKGTLSSVQKFSLNAVSYFGSGYLAFSKRLGQHDSKSLNKACQCGADREDLHKNEDKVSQIDSWYSFNLDPLVKKIHKQNKYDFVLVEYVYLSRVLNNFGKDVTKVIDTHDVFTGRKEKYEKLGVVHTFFSTTASEEKKGLERADRIIAIQKDEADFFKKMTSRPVYTVGHFVEERNFDRFSKKGDSILFVGAGNTANISAAEDFIENVFPEVRKKLPSCKLVLAGNMCKFIGNYEGVEKMGEVEDLGLLYFGAGVVINPTTVGTGLKIKNIECLSYFKPLVMTRHAAEGMEGNGVAFLVANNNSDFAKKIVRILSSEEEYLLLANGAREYVQKYNGANLRTLRAIFS